MGGKKLESACGDRQITRKTSHQEALDHRSRSVSACRGPFPLQKDGLAFLQVSTSAKNIKSIYILQHTNNSVP